MPAPSTSDNFLTLVRKSEIIDQTELEACVEGHRADGTLPDDVKDLARLLIRDGVLTRFQAEQFLQGRWRGFTVGKYQILERIGAGGMGIVYLGEHLTLHRRVAIKVLPISLAEDARFLKRFYQEAQAVAALDHPNVVHAHDINQDGKLHFLVMEYVDGCSLQDIVDRHGPMDQLRAAHYLRQAALGLQHIHDVGLIHRDLKPGNLLLSRQGVVKILDMGLVRFFRNPEVAGKKGPKMIVGTDDYLAPEQVVNSNDVDTRADIYGLGATFYFVLSGRPPFHETSLAYQKLLRHVSATPKPICSLRAEVSAKLAAVIEKMMHKNPWQRIQTAAALADVLEQWTRTPVPAPPEKEMPQLSLAARKSGILRAAPLSGEYASAPGRGAPGSSIVRWGIADANSKAGLLVDSSRPDKPSPAPRTPPTRMDEQAPAAALAAPAHGEGAAARGRMALEPVDNGRLPQGQADQAKPR